MNYAYTENCTGVTINNSHKREKNGPLRLNYAHIRENNAHARDNNALKEKLFFTHLAPHTHVDDWAFSPKHLKCGSLIIDGLGH